MLTTSMAMSLVGPASLPAFWLVSFLQAPPDKSILHTDARVTTLRHYLKWFWVIFFLNIIQGHDYQMWNCLAWCPLLRKHTMNAGFLFFIYSSSEGLHWSKNKAPHFLAGAPGHLAGLVSTVHTAFRPYRKALGFPPHLPISFLYFPGLSKSWPSRDRLKCHLCQEVFQKHPFLYHHRTYWFYLFLVKYVSLLEIMY